MEQKKINWKQKLTSRKLWFAVVGVVVGVAMAFGVEGTEIEEIVAMVSGALAAVGSILGYISGEAKVDAAREKAADLAALLGMAAGNTSEGNADKTEDPLAYLELGDLEK